ncbi:hypothetical protein C8Q73DRAFT_664234 [Cubamyces lactineus]|nr:hypothetical protein C8Q73DRAFT_664234 [Cubamyces lactineus]
MPGATIIPIIISSDKTQLTIFGSKTTYPVYMTIGNLPKDASRRRTLANLFHACMSHTLAPLRKAGIDGIEVISGDGVARRGHPIFAMYIGDYPEQLLVTCCKNGTCPKCTIPREQVGDTTGFRHPSRDLEQILEALDEYDNSLSVLSRACRAAGIKPVVNPFWQDLPYIDIFRSITPDMLHQLYQGVIKHLLAWLKAAYSPEELDARCWRLPPNHQIRLFMKGITSLQRYPAHTADTLNLLQDALRRFHVNKDIFIQLGIRLHFRLLKLHALDHYVDSIKLFGTTDNYDTQYTERLHIDFAKDAYRATNHKDEFPQMTVWLERREKILRHEAYVHWRLQHLTAMRSSPSSSSDNSLSSAQQTLPPVTVASQPVSAADPEWTRIKITKWPSVRALSFDTAAERYAAEVEHASLSVRFHFRKVAAYHKLKFSLIDAQRLGIMDTTQDVAHARPSRHDKHGRQVPGRFDTVLINDGTDRHSGIQGYEVAQLQLVFKLSARACEDLFPDVLAPGYLAYVERFTPFTAPDAVHGMYKVKRRRNVDGARLASVVELVMSNLLVTYQQ